MQNIATFGRALLKDEDGLTMVEYAVMGALIAATLITALVALSGAIENEFTRLKTVINNN